jgi:hypothetical protein
MSRANEKAHELLMQRAEQVRSGAEILLEKTRDWQIIKDYMSRRYSELHLELTESQQAKLDLYSFIYAQLGRGKFTTPQIICQLQNLHGRSLSQAYEDIRFTKELFGEIASINKLFELNNQLEIAKRCQSKCEELLDFKNAKAFGALIRDIIADIPDAEDTQALDFHGYNIDAVFDPKLLGDVRQDVNMKEILTAINAKRKVPIKIDMFEELNVENPEDE